jgi:predicted small lipoprotein YifL
MKTWITSLALWAAPLAALLTGCGASGVITPDHHVVDHQIQSERQQNKQMKIIGKCLAIEPTMKNHLSYIFTFKVISVPEGEFSDSTIKFETHHGFGGGELLEAIEGEYDKKNGWKTEKFDRNREILLIFERNPYYNDYYFKDFKLMEDSSKSN